MMFKIYVGNISYKTPAEMLNKLFSTYGLVDEVIYVTDPETNKPRGFAFVLMPDETQGRAAVSALNGRPVNGRRLSVSEAGRGRQRPKPRPTAPATGGDAGAPGTPRPIRGARVGARFSHRPMRRDRR